MGLEAIRSTASASSRTGTNTEDGVLHAAHVALPVGYYVLPVLRGTRYKIQASRGAYLYYVPRTSSELIKGETKEAAVHPRSKPGRSEDCRFPIGEDA